MKRAKLLLLLSVMAAAVFTGCGKKEKPTEGGAEATTGIIDEVKSEIVDIVEEEHVTEEQDQFADEIPEGMYRSEINGTIISQDIRDQRPVAVMVDNESKALPHFGVNDSDVVYEMMNSTANDRITRLMCIVKDWKKISQLGSIRSTRPTNIPIAAEWNAVLVHDGGPFYIDEWLAKDYSAHFSGGFGRVKNGKATEFTEYVLTGELEKRFASSKYTTDYNEFYPMENTDEGERQGHFLIANGKKDLSENPDARDCSEVVLPFKHTNSTLKYNESTGTYDYYLYGNAHNDGATGEVLSFQNVILQDCTFAQLDKNGYMIYNCIDTSGREGYYITGGKAIPITWKKASDTDVTRFYDKDDNQIEINAGKTYICLVPSDTWEDVSIK